VLCPSHHRLPRRIPSPSAADCRPSRLLALLCAAVTCRSTPLQRLLQCHGQALAVKRPAQCSLLAPVRVRHLGHHLAPPLVMCSLTTPCTPARPFCRVAPRRSLPLQRGADSRLAPKCAASRQVTTVVAATAPEPLRCRTHACMLCLAPCCPHVSAPIKWTP
jgi:hypothetical protein